MLLAPTVGLLCIRVSGSGCFPLVKNTEIISAFPYPTWKKGLQCFLGILIFSRRFIKGAARLPHLLTEILKGNTCSSWPCRLGFFGFWCLQFSSWNSPAARGIQLLGPYGVLLKEVICLRIQILLLQLKSVHSLLLSPPFLNHVRR